MNITSYLLKWLVFLFASSAPLQAISYTWEIQSLSQAEVVDSIKNNGPLASREVTASTITSLCQLADNQKEYWLLELHSRAFFNAAVDWELNNGKEPLEVVFTIDPGVIYPLQTVEVIWSGDQPFEMLPEELDLVINKPAFPSTIIEAEEKFLYLMALRGYPLAKILQRDVIADQALSSVNVTFLVESGKEVVFGETRITGNDSIDESFIAKKITWKTGKTFNPQKIERTQSNLEASGLFSSVVIQEGVDLDSEGRIPVEILLTEAKHRTIAGGIGYSTQQGVGLSGEWQHRNFRGMGERIQGQAKLWSAVQTGQVEYLIPGFRRPNQDLRFVAEADHEQTKGYTELSGSLSAMIDKRINDWTFLTYGASYKQLRTTHSDNNGVFHLLKFPVQFKWSTANDILNPTIGLTLHAKSIPAFQLGKHAFGYWENSGTLIGYYPLTSDDSIVIASKLTAGTIIGASRREIPPSERFYSGTENTLRGYRFLSVSPLDEKNKPIGGRSKLIFSTEARWKCTEKIGLAAFYEVGNVYASPLPEVAKKQLQSVGAGIRYETGVGPIRLDVAVPLNRRRHVDPPFQIYMSIGQAF